MPPLAPASGSLTEENELLAGSGTPRSFIQTDALPMRHRLISDPFTGGRLAAWTRRVAEKARAGLHMFPRAAHAELVSGRAEQRMEQG
jgi:hypothetical protein